MASKTAAAKPSRKTASKSAIKSPVKAAGKPAAKIATKPVTKASAKTATRKATSKTARKSSVKVSAAPKAAPTAGTKSNAAKTSATLQEAVANVHASVQAVASSTPASAPIEGSIGYTEVAIASLCQSYAHTLSLAFHDIVLNQQRRAALGQAALARAIEQIQTADPKDFEEKLGQMRKGLDVLGVSGSNDIEDFTAMSQQFVDAANQLVAVREKIAS